MTLLTLLRRRGAGGGGVAAPTYWMDSAYDSRVLATLTNTQSRSLHDHQVNITVPAGVDANSLRAVETTSLTSIDKAYDWRYPATVNHFWTLPASISGTTVTVKMLGKWAASETRYLHLYWNAAGGIAALNYKHLDGIPQTWSVAVVAGNTSDTYTLNMGGATYTHIMTAAQTAAQIGAALAVLINAGAVATATGTSTLTITQVNKTDGTFVVTNTGSILTGSGALTITRPSFFGLGRVGPDTTAYNATAWFLGYPFGNPTSAALTRPGFGRATSMVAARLMSYSVNGVGTQAPLSGTLPTVTNDGPRIRATGALAWTRTEWTSTYSVTHSQHFFSGRKSDDTNTAHDGLLLKEVDVMRLTLTYTCAVAYTPTAVASNATVLGGHEMIACASTANTFTSNVTEAAGNQRANFYAPLDTGTLTTYISTDTAALTALPVTGSTATIIGAHGNAMGQGICIESVTLANFGSQTPEAKWTTQGNAFGVLHLRNLSASFTVPVGATVTIVATVVSGFTNAATTVGDNLLPDEIVTLIQGILGTQPTVSVGATETYAAASLTATMALAGSRAVEGIQWFQTNALAKTTVTGNFAYQWQVKSLTVSQPDDDDGNMGDAHKLSGLCLRYLRTHDAALIAVIEAQVGFHLQLEADMISQYGVWWSGSAPYGYWNSATSSASLYTLDGGVGTDAAQVDPNSAAYPAFGPITYTQGQLRRHTSVDQIHHVAIGLYHYIYLLRNEAAITANTTLRTNALALLARMETFEAAHITASNRTVANLYDLCTGGTPAFANGITSTLLNQNAGTALANPYWGTTNNFEGWQVSNTDALQIGPSSNAALDNFFRAVFASGSVEAGVLRYLKGASNDMVASDASHHEVTFSPSTWHTSFSSSVFPSYPAGWMLRANATGNNYKWTSGRTGDDHFLSLTSGVRDAMSGRAAQRLIVLCLTALLDPAYAVPVEQNTTTTLRTTPILTEINALARILALYLVEPTTKAQRMSASGWLGEPSSAYDPQTVDSAFTGYWMMAIELWYLVQAGANPDDYYAIP